MTHTSRSTFASLSLLTSILVFPCFQSTASAQAVAVAQISGTITDSTGKAIVNAEVTMTETDKQLVRSTVSNETGYTLLG